jgi:hypothetical protein
MERRETRSQPSAAHGSREGLVKLNSLLCLPNGGEFSTKLATHTQPTHVVLHSRAEQIRASQALRAIIALTPCSCKNCQAHTEVYQEISHVH